MLPLLQRHAWSLVDDMDLHGVARALRPQDDDRASRRDHLGVHRPIGVAVRSANVTIGGGAAAVTYLTGSLVGVTLG